MSEHVNLILRSERFYRSLSLIDAAIDAIHTMLDLGHDVRICISPLIEFPYCVPEKYAWVYEHLGKVFTNRMILTKDKTLVRGEVLIEDKPNIIGGVSPVWKHIFYDALYNRNINDSVCV